MTATLNSWIPPIVLDLDGDGVETSGIFDSEVLFDIDADGFLERTGWVSPDDGILAIDLDGNGIIDQAREFVFTYHAPDAEGDLEALRQAFDTNGNGILDSGDARFADFRVWRDLDQDGVSDERELQSLSAAGIAQVNLVGTVPATIGNPLPGENSTLAITTFTRSDGSLGQAADVAFAFDLIGVSASTGDGVRWLTQEDGQTFAFFEGGADRTISVTPDVSGLTGAEGRDTFVASAEITGSLLLRGNGGDDTLHGGSGRDMLIGDDGADNLSGGAGDDLLVVDRYDVIDGGSGYDTVRVVDDSGVTIDLAAARVEAVSGGAGADTLDARGAMNVLLNGGAGDDVLLGGDGADILEGGAGADCMLGGKGDDIVTFDVDDLEFRGGEGFDTLVFGGDGAIDIDIAGLEFESLHGGDTHDRLANTGAISAQIFGGDGDDILESGTAGDILAGGNGNDRFVLGGGNDRVLGGDGTDPAPAPGAIAAAADGGSRRGRAGDDRRSPHQGWGDKMVIIPTGFGTQGWRPSPSWLGCRHGGTRTIDRAGRRAGRPAATPAARTNDDQA